MTLPVWWASDPLRRLPTVDTALCEAGPGGTAGLGRPAAAPAPADTRLGGQRIGQSTLSRALSALLSVPYHELDAFYHGPRWVPRPQFTADVIALAATERWVTEWQSSAVRPILLARADLIVWLDLP
ncbi:MAG: hypothetical protein ABR608_10080 [Pseudonocardiaceae bacterium]